MKHTKRLLSIVLMLTMLLSMFTVTASAATTECDHSLSKLTYVEEDTTTEAYYSCKCGLFFKANGTTRDTKAYSDPSAFAKTLLSSSATTTCAHNKNSNDTHFDAVTATCVTKGTPEYWQCKDCGKYYWDGITDVRAYSPVTSTYSGYKTNPNNHLPASVEHADEVDADCQTAGNKEYWHCKDCDAYFLEATCSTAVDATDVFGKDVGSHVVRFVSAKAPTTENKGNIEYWVCNVCGKKFENKDATKEITGSVELDKLTEVKHTVTVKIEGASNGTVKVKGTSFEVKNGSFIDLAASEEYPLVATPKSSKYAVSWYLDGKYVSSKTEYTLKNIEKDCTLKVVFEKKSSYTHTHDWGTSYEYNDTYHWKECIKSGCDAVKSGSKEKHDLKTYYKDGYYYSYCTECDYDTWDYYYYSHSTSHTGYDYEDYNATYHWKECKKCDYAVKEYHTWIKNTDRKTKDSYPYVCKYCDRLSKSNDSYYLPFHDVNDSYWYYDDVLYAYLNGLMDGISVNDFGATQNTTRAQVVTILWRLTGEPRATRDNKFTDVSSSAYYNNAISWAVDAGIVDGFDAYTFKPTANVTREQLAAILYRYAAYMNLSTKGASNLLKFDDYYSIGTWARDAMAWANYHGLINGVGYSKIDPKGYATRAQVAAILHRFAVEFA